MKRASGDDADGGLDSLLDTMTNVVGILIIVLVVTQLGVGEAVKRIADNIRVDPEEYRKTEEELKKEKDRNARLLAAMNKEEPVDTDIDRLLSDIDAQQKVKDDLLEQKKAHEAELAKRGQEEANREEREKEISEASKKRDEVSEESKSAEDRIQELEALLDKTPEREVLSAREITLPDPKPAPEGAQQLTFVCAKNKVYPLPVSAKIEEIRKLSQARAVQVARKQYRTFKPVESEGIDRFLEEFNQRPWRDDFGYFEVKLANYGGSPRLVFHLRDTGGDTEKLVKAPKSKFRQALQTIDRSKYFIRFYVCSDSFDIYVTTRRIVSDMGLLAGWEPQSSNWIYTTHLGGDLRLGPPPKPTPPPKTPPKPVPKRPPNVID